MQEWGGELGKKEVNWRDIWVRKISGKMLFFEETKLSGVKVSKESHLLAKLKGDVFFAIW